jgi:hypothetical protein
VAHKPDVRETTTLRLAHVILTTRDLLKLDPELTAPPEHQKIAQNAMERSPRSKQSRNSYDYLIRE